MATPRWMTVLIWHACGVLFPLLQAFWANRVARKRATATVDTSGRFIKGAVCRWAGILRNWPGSGEIADQIYELEIGRRNAITGKAQASLNTTALIVAVLAFLATIFASQDRFRSVFPEWLLGLLALYMLAAFLGAFRAVHIHRQSAVELDELKELTAEQGGGHEDDLVVGFRARKLAAVESNRTETLCISNLVDASFKSLRNAIVLLLLAPLFERLLKYAGVLSGKIVVYVCG